MGRRFGGYVDGRGHLTGASHGPTDKRRGPPRNRGGNAFVGHRTGLRYQLQVIVLDICIPHHLRAGFHEIVPILPHTVVNAIPFVDHIVLRAVVVKTESVKSFRHPYFFSIGKLHLGGGLRLEGRVRYVSEITRVE